MRSCLIVAGGAVDVRFARSYLKQEHFDKVIAVDGGLALMEPLGLEPDYAVGDFDSVKPDILDRFHQIPYIVWDAHRPEKNETDTELARSRALTLGCGRIVFLGAMGGRMDHMLSNLHTLYACLQSGTKAYLIDPQNRVCLIDGETHFTMDGQWGKYISFLPYTEEVTGITLQGFKYPLKDRVIRRGEETGLCISNELAAEEGVITLSDGILVCIESRD